MGDGGQPGPVRAVAIESQQFGGIVTSIDMGVLMELGVADPVPTFTTSTVAYQLLQIFWIGGRAGDLDAVRPRRPYRWHHGQDQAAFQIQRDQQLSEHCPLVGVAGSIGGLGSEEAGMGPDRATVG